MSLHPPRPIVALLPPEQLPAKVDTKLVLALDADSGVNVVGMAWEVYAGEGVAQTQAVPCEEDGACGELVAEADSIAR
jgi:hypothetical protein